MEGRAQPPPPPPPPAPQPLPSITPPPAGQELGEQINSLYKRLKAARETGMDASAVRYERQISDLKARDEELTCSRFLGTISLKLCRIVGSLAARRIVSLSDRLIVVGLLSDRRIVVGSSDRRRIIRSPDRWRLVGSSFIACYFMISMTQYYYIYELIEKYKRSHKNYKSRYSSIVGAHMPNVFTEPA